MSKELIVRNHIRIDGVYRNFESLSEEEKKIISTELCIRFVKQFGGVPKTV